MSTCTTLGHCEGATAELEPLELHIHTVHSTLSRASSTWPSSSATLTLVPCIHGFDLYVKDEYEDEAKAIFGDTYISVTTRGKRHLGASVRSRDFATEYVSHKVEEWCEELMSLAKIAESQPHAAFTAFIHSMTSKWTYVCRTISKIDDLLRPLDEVIHQHLIPAITGRPHCSLLEWKLLALPPRLGGLGLYNPSSNSQSKFESSKQVPAFLVP